MSDNWTRRWARLADEVAVRDGLTAGLIAIDGRSGSGKSTFAAELVRALADRGRRSVLISTDEFATWDDPASWWPELERDVLRAFERRHDYLYRPRVWVDGVPEIGPAVWIRWQPLLIVEGVTAARRTVADQLTAAYWIDGPAAQERLERTVARDGEAARAHLAAWQQFEDGWFAVDGARDRCRVLG
ncbi:uridine kinase family protein [Gordonia sp. MP11Mi]|uniref:Uridine kinase n=1 Tax=Gordonia sp. MP11Mi TaxID=3022769 RepID=A0AA97CU99_9ACTN